MRARRHWYIWRHIDTGCSGYFACPRLSRLKHARLWLSTRATFTSVSPTVVASCLREHCFCFLTKAFEGFDIFFTVCASVHTRLKENIGFAWFQRYFVFYLNALKKNLLTTTWDVREILDGCEPIAILWNVRTRPRCEKKRKEKYRSTKRGTKV